MKPKQTLLIKPIGQYMETGQENDDDGEATRLRILSLVKVVLFTLIKSFPHVSVSADAGFRTLYRCF